VPELNLLANIFEQKELVISFFIFKFLLLLYIGRRYYLRNKYLKTILKREETYRYLFENSVTATLLSAKDGTIVMANGQFEKLTGFRNDEIQGKRYSDIVSFNGESENCKGQSPDFSYDQNSSSWSFSIVKNKTNDETSCHTNIQSDENEEYTIMSFFGIKSNGYHLTEKPTSK
jgi:PAS domain S-box-containing protein